MTGLRKALLGTVLGFGLVAGSAANAAIINGSDFTNGLPSQVIGGLNWTATGGTFQQKGGFTPTGVGISGGQTNDEIDIGETLTATGAGFGIGSITIGVLFDGPEFSDVNEIARITINGVTSYTLTATYSNAAGLNAIWTGPGTVSNLSPAVSPGGSATWKLDFTGAAITGVNTIAFTAIAGACGNGPCTNDSDFTLVQMTTVPEPATLALFGAGLLGLGLARRRRRAA